MQAERVNAVRPKTIGGKLFKKWILKNGESQKAVAEALGVTSPYISRWIGGTIVPGLEMAARIQELTKGQVKAVSWLDASR